MLPVYYILFGRILTTVSFSFAISRWLLSVVEGIFKTPPLWWFAGVSSGLSDPLLWLLKDNYICDTLIYFDKAYTENPTLLESCRCPSVITIMEAGRNGAIINPDRLMNV